MANTTTHAPPSRKLWSRIDKTWLAIFLILACVAVLDWPRFWPTVTAAASSLGQTAPFILFAILAIAYLKATGAETLLARAFEGRETRMIVFAAFLGGLSPFCSCEVIPFIAALLAVGAPLSAVMAFWLSSPLMDPAMYSITAGELGFDFATAKLVAAIGIGLLGGFGTMLLKASPVFADPLRTRPQAGGCCSSNKPFLGRPKWAFWTESERVETFRKAAVENGAFLLKWLALAYVIEAIMIHYVPASMVSSFLGGDGLKPVILGALVGMPAYLNGYAAVPLVSELLDMGMANGAAMSFVLAGGVSCIPAAIAVWALVKPRVFAAYLGFALVGSLVAGVVWQTIA